MIKEHKEQDPAYIDMSTISVKGSERGYTQDSFPL